MKILVVTNLPSGPVFGGDILRIRKLAQHLSINHKVTFLCAGENNVWFSDNIKFVSVSALSFAEKFFNYLSAIIRPHLPMQAYMFRNIRIEKYIKQHSHEYDVVVFHLIRCFPYFSNIKHPRVVIDLTDSISMNYYRIKKPHSLKELFFVFERRRLLSLERNVAKNTRFLSVFISEVDANFVGANNAVVVPNGVDIRVKEVLSEPRYDSLFIGNCRSVSNFKSLQRLIFKILPKILKCDPEFTLAVIGFVPEKFKASIRSKNVIFLGNVHDLSDFVGHFRMGFAPIDFGAGIQNKVLDYISLSAVPIVSTIAAEGFSDLHTFLEICETDDEFAVSALNFKEFPPNEKISELIKLLLENYSWHSQLSKIDSLVN